MLVNLVIFFFGSILGSFLNVCICRFPKEESIVFPSSHCPKCKTPIKPYDNIPIISYLILRGRCRKCQEKISFRYPIVELLTGLVILFNFTLYQFSPEFFFSSIFSSLLIIGLFTDLEELIIPDEIVIVGLILGFVRGYINGSIQDSILGAAMGFAVFFLIAYFAKMILKKEALGYGDLKLGAMLGSYLGLLGFWNVFFIAYILGAAISLVLIALKIKTMEDLVPFGPFLIIAATITAYRGPEFVLAVFL